MEDLGLIRWFLDTASTRSFTATARQFGVTAAAVSQGIARLEQQLGTRLFHRTTRQINLTSEGQMFYDHARDGLAKLDTAATFLKEMRAEPNGVIRFSVSASFGKYVILPMLAPFLERYPRIDLDISFYDGPVDLIREGFDLALRMLAHKTTYCVTRSLCKPPLILLASPKYLSGRKIPRHPGDLRDHDWVTLKPSPDTLRSDDLIMVVEKRRSSKGKGSATDKQYKIHFHHDHANKRRAEHGGEFLIEPKFNRIVVSGQHDATFQAALAGIGITLGSSYLAMPYLRSGELKLLLPDYRFQGNTEIFIQYPNREYLSQKVRVLIDFLIAAFSEDNALSADPSGNKNYVAA